MDFCRVPFILLLALTFAAPAAAQSGVSIRISTEPAGARFTVDGQPYYAAATFLWPLGSKHTVSVVTSNFNTSSGGAICNVPASEEPVQYETHCRARYGFAGWKSNGKTELPGAAALTQVIVADGSFSALTARFDVEYRIELAMPAGLTGPTPQCRDKADRPGAPPRPGESIGIVFIGSDCYDFGGTLWKAPGTYGLQAMPLTGYAFDGWVIDGIVAPSVTSYTVRGPATLLPRFLPAKRVTLFTDPIELKVRVDRTEIHTGNPVDNNPVYPTPGVYDWLPGSKHILGAPSPQVDRESGHLYVFDAWSTGGGQDMVYTPDSEVATPVTLVARFVRGTGVSFETEPKGLKLSIDGRSNWLSYGFHWGLGSKHEFSAPAEQVDAHGRKWNLRGWKHGGPPAQQVVIDQKAVESGGVTYTAVYQSVPQVTIRSSLPGVTVRVDGEPCATPCVLDRPAGTRIRLSVPETVQVNELNRHQFKSWSDGFPAERAYSFDAETAELRAVYRQAFRLIMSADPPEAAVIRCDPVSPDGFYDSETPVSVTVEPKAGYRFRRWEGDIEGAVPSGVVGMTAPRAVRALLIKTEPSAEIAVRNAAGETPVAGVAPGSLIAVTGPDLASATVSGPVSPLAQTLGGVAVTVADRVLPLVSVSPEKVIALLPSDLGEGEHHLSVRLSTGRQLSTSVTVVRIAPGLFGTPTESGVAALALRDDGSPVSTANPLRPGEFVTLLGTGFGPYDHPVLDGFPAPNTRRSAVKAQISVRLGDASYAPEWAGAAPGLTGVVAVRFQLPPDIRGTRIASVFADGVESNAVPLPVE